MEQSPENNASQDAGPEQTTAVPLGRTLREARERLGLSIADVANQIKLAQRQIEALEADDFQHLPEMPFVRGFVRGYAKLLQLDAQPLLASLPQASANPVQLVPASVDAPFPSAHSPQRQNLIWLGAALLLSVLVVAFAVWHFTTPPAKPEVAKVETPVSLPDQEPQAMTAPQVAEADAIAHPAARMQSPSAEATQPPVPAEKVTTPKAVPQAQTAKPPAQPEVSLQDATLRLTFGEDSWTEIKDKDDKILASQINLQGSELRLKGQAPFSLVIGHAASVRLYYRGKQVDLTPHINSTSEVARLTLE